MARFSRTSDKIDWLFDPKKQEVADAIIESLRKVIEADAETVGGANRLTLEFYQGRLVSVSSHYESFPGRW